DYITLKRDMPVIIDSIFVGNFFTFRLMDKINFLKKWTADYLVDSQVYFNEKLEMKKLGEVSYSSSDLKFLEIKDAQVEATLPDAKELSCGEYALLKTRAPIVKELFKNSDKINHTLSWWEKQGYQVVEKEPQANDLALYLNSDGKI